MIDNPKNKINEFGFDRRKCKASYGLMHDPATESEENKNVMIMGLQNFCMCCRLCDMGCKLFGEHDPHIVSNLMFNAKFMLVGYSPHIDDYPICLPFQNEASKIFEKELKKNKIKKNNFYTTNIIKCMNDRKPNKEDEKTCSDSFFTNEIKIIQPKMLVVVDKLAFGFLCPGEDYESGIGKITRGKFGKVYSISINHEKFDRQVELLSKLIKLS